jgi:hypothetical protein
MLSIESASFREVRVAFFFSSAYGKHQHERLVRSRAAKAKLNARNQVIAADAIPRRNASQASKAQSGESVFFFVSYRWCQCRVRFGGLAPLRVLLPSHGCGWLDGIYEFVGADGAERARRLAREEINCRG